MAKTMIAAKTEMTDGQIENAVGKLRDAMRKHRSDITSGIAQQVLGVENLGMMMFTPFRERAEAVSNLIVRTAKVNRNRTKQGALDVTGRVQYTDKDVVAKMPQGEGDKVEVVFFKLGRFVNNNDLEKEFDLRGFKPVDPISLAAVNEADQAFADDHPNGTYWKDSSGDWCYIAFDCWHDERRVRVFRDVDSWNAFWWFAGLRK